MISQALDALPGGVLSIFLVLCRIGGCLMVLPAIGGARVPVRVRLMVCLAISVAVAFALGNFESARESLSSTPSLVSLVLVETAKGLVIGIMVRFFFASLKFLAVAGSAALGLAMPVNAVEEDGETTPPLAEFVSLTAAFLFLATDQHLEVLKALLQSYTVLPIGTGIGLAPSLSGVVDTLRDACLVSLQVVAPLLVFAFLVNLLFGVLNRIAPQTPAYFLSMPFVIGGGMLIFYFIAGEMFLLFMGAFASWLREI
ncbi:flagellar biosynthetic protein FliR [Rhodomicrobium vannielii ATCC 17100]|uniref:flagellar biosynthetic protein FliR n=1 Tax=Rhodomicrobium vannielii TaxID=1069 RepID=UPI00191B6B26|nr:flagellar biosynthetic protein FliR [Rhodomicrobium vannielii ATCC 17100]